MGEVEARDPPIGPAPPEVRWPPFLAGRVVHVATRWNSRATPIAATPERPVPACALRYRIITAILRSPLTNRTTGMWFSAASLRTSSRNRSPIRPTTAGEGIGNPRFARICTTCPPT